MSEVKKQHFIPQFLLRNFAHGKKKRERLWTFDKKRQVCYPSSVTDTAHQNRFYEGKSLDGDKRNAEGVMQYVDGIGAKALQEVLQKRLLPLTGESFVAISYFVAAQMFRVPSIRNEMEFLRRTIIERWGTEIRFEHDERGIGEYSAGDSKFSSINSLDDVPEFARLLQTKVWFLQLAPPESCFILSDNPVVKYNHLDYGPRGSLGLAQDGIDICLPISPKMAVQMVCPKIANALNLSMAGREWLHCQNRGEPISLEYKNVEFVNSLQVIQSERYLYAEREMHFQIAREMLSEHTNLTIPASEKTVS